MDTPHSEHMLDNPMWHALTTAHAHLAEGDALARRYPPAVTPLAGVAEQSEAAYASLSRVMQGQPTAALFLDTAPAPPEDWEILVNHLITQMVWRGGERRPRAARILTLTLDDIPEMIALTTLTEPGPFAPRALELGEYVGIREGGQLVAMAGERLHLHGFTEVSAVCTHPDFRGRGLSQALVSAVMDNILSRNETPMLHVRTQNVDAIRVYEKLGFRTRREIHLGVLRAPST